MLIKLGLIKDGDATAKAKADRWKGIVRNNLETVPLGFTVLLAATFADPASAAICSIIFFSARFLYVICAALGLQPWRSLVWFVADIAILVAGGMAVAAAGAKSTVGGGPFIYSTAAVTVVCLALPFCLNRSSVDDVEGALIVK